jgi:hypothetical protein
MDFLRDFRSGGSATDSDSEWKPSTEVVLGIHDLPASQAGEVICADGESTADDGASAEESPGQASAAHQTAVNGTEDWAREEDDDGSDALVGAIAGVASSRSARTWTPSVSRKQSSRTAWAALARPTPTGWGPHDAWSGHRIPAASKPRRWNRSTVVVAAVVVLALLAAGAVYVVRRERPSYPSVWDPRVAPIAAFVQNARGLTWKHPVSVQFLPTAQFDAATGAGVAPASGESAKGPTTEQQIEVARSFGLVWGNSPAPSTAAVLMPAVYDQQKKAVYVDGVVVTPLVDASLANALTSALEGEYFNLHRIVSGSGNDESAASALIEGAADRVEQAYVESRPAATQRLFQTEYQVQDAAAHRVLAALPAFVADGAAFPDDFGLTLVDALYSQGGNVELDEAFRDPPALDGEVVNPASYQPGLPSPKVDAPPVPAGATTVIRAEGFGEVPLVETLGYEIGFSAAWRAVSGWTSDRFVAFDLNGRMCTALSVLSDNAADAGALAEAGSQWSHHVPGASVVETGLTVVFRTCDPGPNWRPAQGGADPYRFLAARAGFIDTFIADSHFDADGATCVADELLTRLGPQQLLRDENLPSLSNPTGRALTAAIRQAVPECGISGPTTTN